LQADILGNMPSLNIDVSFRSIAIAPAHVIELGRKDYRQRRFDPAEVYIFYRTKTDRIYAAGRWRCSLAALALALPGP
jgi:hypothetical protein